jgi:hypothetical protein
MHMMRGVAAAIIVAGCSAQPGPATPTGSTICPSLKNYSLADQKRDAGEIVQMDQAMPGNHLHALLDDYEQLRAETKACIAQK